MKRIIFLALFLASSVFAQSPTSTPTSASGGATATPTSPVPTDTPQLEQAEAQVPRYISVVGFEATTQYGPQIPKGTLDMTYEYVVSSQDGIEMKRRTHVLNLNQIPAVERAKLLDFLKWMRAEVETRVLPPAALTPFSTHTPAPTAPPTPIPSLTPTTPPP